MKRKIPEFGKKKYRLRTFGGVKGGAPRWKEKMSKPFARSARRLWHLGNGSGGICRYPNPSPSEWGDSWFRGQPGNIPRASEGKLHPLSDEEEAGKGDTKGR